MSKQKSRQQIRLEQRQARKKRIQPQPVPSPFWKKSMFWGMLALILVVGIFVINAPSKKETYSSSLTPQTDNSLIASTSLSPSGNIPKGAKIRRKGRWVTTKNLQPGDSIWHKGKWQVIKGVSTIDTLLPEDPKRPIIDYFVDPNRLQQVFAFKPVPLSRYTTKEIEIQRGFNKHDLLLTYATISDSVYAKYDNLTLPAHKRNIDFDEITPWTWKTFNLEIINPDSSKVKIQLRRPHWWMSQHKIKGVGSKVHLSLPEQGIEGIATVTFIRPCQIDTRLLPDRNKTGKVYRPFTGWFERTSDNVWNYAFSNGEVTGATPEHPYFSEDRQLYIPIGEVKIGERLKTHNGQIVTLVGRKKRSKGVEKVYNLEVYRTHTFYVGKGGFLVHNSYIANVPLDKHQHFLKHQGKFEAQGKNIVIKDQALLKEVETLGNKQSDFFKDIVGDAKLLDEVVQNQKLVKAWEVMQDAGVSSLIRKNREKLNVLEYYLSKNPGQANNITQKLKQAKNNSNQISIILNYAALNSNNKFLRAKAIVQNISKNHPNMTIEEITSIYYYTSSEYLVINRTIRGNKEKRFILSLKETLDQALAKIPDYKGTVYRIDHNDVVPNHIFRIKETYEKGNKVFNDKAFFSSTYSQKAFVRLDQKLAHRKYKAYFTIESKNGKNIEQFSKEGVNFSSQNQAEVLFKTNTQFEITFFQQNQNTFEIHLKEL